MSTQAGLMGLAAGDPVLVIQGRGEPLERTVGRVARKYLYVQVYGRTEEAYDRQTGQARSGPWSRVTTPELRAIEVERTELIRGLRGVGVDVRTRLPMEQLRQVAELLGVTKGQET